MTATPTGWLLMALVASYLLHVYWRLIAGRSGVAVASFVAGYFVLSFMFRHSDPIQPLRPIWLPFVFGYVWVSIAAAFWVLGVGRISRQGLHFTGEEPRLAALFSSQLTLTAGTALLSPWLEWRPLAAYVMLPPLVVVLSYIFYRFYADFFRRRQAVSLPWVVLLGCLLLMPLVLMGLGHWLAPILLGWT